MQIDSRPEEVDQLERRILQLEIERQALKKESDRASQERLGQLDQELSTLKGRSGELKAQLAQLTGLEKVGTQVIGKLGEQATKIEGQVQGELGKAAKDAEKGAQGLEDQVNKTLGGLLKQPEKKPDK